MISCMVSTWEIWTTEASIPWQGARCHVLFTIPILHLRIWSSFIARTRKSNLFTLPLTCPKVRRRKSRLPFLLKKPTWYRYLKRHKESCNKICFFGEGQFLQISLSVRISLSSWWSIHLREAKSSWGQKDWPPPQFASLVETCKACMNLFNKSCTNPFQDPPLEPRLHVLGFINLIVYQATSLSLSLSLSLADI